MGTLTIIELTGIGGQGAVGGSPVIDLSSIGKTTKIDGTSATAAALALQPNTRYVVLRGVDVDHDISVKSDDLSERYIPVGTTGAEFAVQPSDKQLYYKTS